MTGDLKVPTIHMNGTAREDLDREYEQAIERLTLAYGACRDITVHGRDYYVQKDEHATRAAIDQQAFRLRMLQRILDEYTEILIGIRSQAG